MATNDLGVANGEYMERLTLYREQQVKDYARESLDSLSTHELAELMTDYLEEHPMP